MAITRACDRGSVCPLFFGFPFDLSKRSAIKGLRSFDSEDVEIFAQLQREQSIRECFEPITASEFRFDVFCGESDCGKNSFLRARLIPRLKQQYQYVYVKLTDLDPLWSIRRALIDQVKKPKAWAETADIKQISNIINSFPEVHQAIIFGSRAMGNYKDGSDADIALKGEDITHELITKIKYRLNEETLLPSFLTWSIMMNCKMKI